MPSGSTTTPTTPSSPAGAPPSRPCVARRIPSWRRPADAGARMIIDAHLHCTGRERVDDVLRALDDARIDVAVLLAPFLNEGHSLDDAASLRRANAHLARLVQRHRDRLIGFAVVDPRDAAAAHDLRVAIEDLGLAGVKMVPTGWYPDEP